MNDSIILELSLLIQGRQLIINAIHALVDGLEVDWSAVDLLNEKRMEINQDIRSTKWMLNQSYGKKGYN